MFTRVYQQGCNGTVELYVEAAHHKEALDRARLSPSEIAKELHEKSMEEFFLDPQDAYDKMAVQPGWKPHTLGKRIKHLVTPDATKKTNYARKQAVTLSYDEENTKAEPTKGKDSYKKRYKWEGKGNSY
jgi:predicted ribosome quality control (RQC) complex YloA/Tae2 family protein